MNSSKMKVLGIFVLCASLLPCNVSADADDSWDYGLSVYGWLPDVSGDTAFPVGDGSDFKVPVESLLDNLQFAMLATFDARKGRWGLLADLVYMDLGNTKSAVQEGTIGDTVLPYGVSARAGFDMKSLILMAAGYYRLVDQQDSKVDIVAGLRHIDIDQSLEWRFSGDIASLPIPGREGMANAGDDYLDAIIGVRGRLGFGQDTSWYIPYYADVGAGGSDMTWQVLGGIGYTFSWGDFAAIWRHLSYDLPSSKPIGKLEFSGPEVGVVFRW